MANNDAKEVAFPIRRILLDMSPPKAAHGFGWSRVDDQFQIEVGYFDLKVMSDIIVQRRKKDATGDASLAEGGLDLFITDRFVMDLSSTKRFVEVMRLLITEYESIEKATTNA